METGEARSPREESADDGEEMSDVSTPSTQTKPSARAGLVAASLYSSGDDDDDNESGKASADDPSDAPVSAASSVAAPSAQKQSPQAANPKLPTLDAWLKTHKKGASAAGNTAKGKRVEAETAPSPSPSRDNSVGDAPSDTSGTKSSPKKRKRKQQPAAVKGEQERPVKSIDELEVSVEALKEVATQRGLDVSALSRWERTSDGRLMDAEKNTFKSVRDAVRTVAFDQTGRIPREDIYFLAILRRKLAETAMPFEDGPITVLSLGRTVPKELFHSQKKLFPVGYEGVASVQLVKAGDARIRLNCKIVEGNNQKSPIFVVTSVADSDIMFRSYVGTKAWKKAISHFESLTADELTPFIDQSDAVNRDCLLSSAGEDGFGLLRRNIARVLEGCHQVLQCSEYLFWEERHPVSPEAHAKLRSRLLKQLKEVLRRDELSKEEIRLRTCQEVLIAEYEMSPEQIHKEKQQRERERREAEKQSVRHAARKLLEIELKAQEDAKEAQRKEREDRKNALIEAKMELLRQKEARKDATRREKEEERRMREEERDMRKFLKEEEKRRKAEEKEMHMQLKIDELRERRRLREQQKSILESGVLSSGTGSGSFHSSMLSPLKAGRDSSEFSIQKQQAALLKFVRDERDRRRRLRFWERRRELEERVWHRVKTEYSLQGLAPPVAQGMKSNCREKVNSDTKSFPRGIFKRVTSFDSVPPGVQDDIIFVWDSISTFSDVLRMPSVPPLDAFVDLLVRSTSSASSGGHLADVDDPSYRLFASINASVVRVLLEEYFPGLQMGTTLEEFQRARPLNLYSWPEVARQVCLLAIESTHPSLDDQVVKALKGTRPNRDDPMLLPVRQRLGDRGSKLLVGEVYEDVQLKDDSSKSDKEKGALRASAGHVPSTTHYGLVVEDGIASLFRSELKDGHMVVAELFFQKKETSPGEEAASATNADLERIHVGDFVLAINGQSITNLVSGQEIDAVVGGIPKPHGLLMTSTPPVTKPTLKHIPTTQTARKLKCCAHVLKVLRSKEIAEPFNQPVDTELYPDYYSAVPEPMDLGTIQEKIEDEEYENDEDVEAFVDDVNLVWKNCFTYNSMKAEISLMAKKLSAIFDRLMEEWVENDVVRPLVLAEEDHCRMCRTDQVRDHLLVCDRCDASYHTFCLTPPLKKVPSEEWYCPKCVLDPSFLPDTLKKKVGDGDKDGGQVTETIEYTDLEKKLLQAVEYLSREDFRAGTLQELIAVSRVLVELFLQSAAVQDTFKSLEDRANDLRRECGDSLAELIQEWERFAPPKAFSGIDCTKRFIVDGIERDLTDELLNYLEEKTIAERDGAPIPDLPVLPRPQSVLEFPESVDESDDSASDDEVQLLEELGDAYLAAVSLDDQPVASAPVPTCHFCGLEDGIVNGPLKMCKQSPLTHVITEINDFVVPPILSRPAESADGTASEPHSLLSVRQLLPQETVEMRLRETRCGGVQLDYSNENEGDSPRTIYSVNDCLVEGMTRDEVAQAIRVAKQPVRIYSAASSMHDALHASISIVSLHTASGFNLGITLAIGADGYVFVQSLARDSYAELSDQVLPGDVLWMVNDAPVSGCPVEEAMQMLKASLEDPFGIIVLVREPSASMKNAAKSKSLNAGVLGAKRARLNEFLTQIVKSPAQRIPRESFDVTFVDGPLGLALALEGRVIVKSLNDNVDGTPGQASLSGLVQAGDVIERVNGKVYGALRDLSQFTASLVTLPRPIVITFSREIPSTRNSGGASEPEMYADPELLCQPLAFPTSTSRSIKTVRVEREQLTSLPFSLHDFGINNSTILSTAGTIPCSAVGNASDPVLRVGDRLVGVNGCSTTGLPWEAIARVLGQVRGALFFHFAERVRLPTVFSAHDACVHYANTAWSDADNLRPKILKATRTEAFIKHIVPRSTCIGKCSSSYAYYHFHGDRHRIYVRSPDGLWLTLASSKTGLHELLLYLKTTGDEKDHKIASRIRDAFPQIKGSPDAGDLILEPFLRIGPFAMKTEVKLITDTGDGDKFEAFISYFGRNYLLGTFGSRQEADAAIKQGELFVQDSGVHNHPELAHTQQTPSLSVPSLKAEMAVRRHFQRRYEHGTGVDAAGYPKRVPISQSVVHSLRRGLHNGGSQLGYGAPAMSGGYKAQQRVQNSLPAPMLVQGEYHKRKIPDSASSVDVRHRVEMQKRPRPHSAHVIQPTGPYPSPRVPSSEVAKRQLQPLADHGRSMLTAWNDYARAPTPQHTQALASACVTSFEEVKKATTRLMADPSHPVPDGSTFVCLHHAFVVGLICAMTTQALTNCQRTNGDSVMVKVVADAFATALLCSIDPSPLVRGRALSGFAAVVKQCDRAMRPHDLSEPLHHIANFILQFVQVSRYLASGSFDDFSQCRPVVSEDQRAMEMLPASFVQQIRLLENVRRAFIARSTRGGPQQPSSSPGGRISVGSYALSNRGAVADELVHVDFGPGPLGIMINYSARGKVVVTEYSNDGAQMGQAQLSGKISIGDEVYAINGRLVETIGGMEGFKAFVASGVRPIRVTFKPTPESMAMPLAGRSAPSLHRQQSPPTASSFGFRASNPSNTQPQLEPMPLANNSHQQMLYNGGMQVGGRSQSMPRSMYHQQPTPQGIGSSRGYPSASFPPTNSVTGYDSLPAPPYEGVPMVNMGASGGWHQQQQPPQLQGYNPAPLMPAPLNPRVDGNAFVTPPPFPRSSASMGFPSPPDITGTPDPRMPAPMSIPPPYGGGFISPNDPNMLPDDSNSISYYDANGTTFRSTPDFEIDTTATSASSVIGDDASTVEGNESILDADTEEENDDSANLNSGTVSQMTTPANSDVESDIEEHKKRHVPVNAVDSEAAPVPAGIAATHLTTLASSVAQEKPTESVDVVDDMTLSMARRSARVPRKITTNIADMYNPELNGSARGRGSDSTKGRNEVMEPTHGEVGELATELLEGFAATIRPNKADVSVALQVLRAQLLTIEAAIPRDAFRAGKWTRAVRAAWGEMVYACDSAKMLMEATLFLESNVENDWLEPWWRAAFLPTARYAISSATLASTAMRLYAFDDAVSYVRVKRGGSGGRRKQQRSGASSGQSSPVKTAMIDLTSSTTNAAVTHPLDLPFVAKLREGTIEVATKIVDRVLSIQRDRSPNIVAHRQAMRQLTALTDLSEDQIDEWVRAALNQQLQQTSQLQMSAGVAGNTSSNGSARQPTPKRKAGISSASSSGPPTNDPRPNRKRKVAAAPHASLPCFQMGASGAVYAIPATSAGVTDPTLRARFELIVKTLLKHELSVPFAAPVNVKDVPGYTDVVEQPMDLGTILTKLSRGVYDRQWERVSQDVNLVWTNCFRYNRIDAEISKCANRLRSIYNRLFEHWITLQPVGTPPSALPSEEACRTCEQSHASDQMLLCDSCDAAYHLFCLAPPLAEIPSGDWFCPRCPIQQLTL